MVWRFAHRFFGWAPPAVATFYGGSLGIAAAAAPANADAKAFLDGQIAVLRDLVSAPWFLPVLAAVVMIWLAAFLWTGTKAEQHATALARRATPTPPAVQERKQAVYPDDRYPRRSVEGLARVMAANGPTNPPGLARFVVNPKPDLPLVDLLERVRRAQGPPPEKGPERKEYWARTDLAVADKVVGEELHTWGRLGQRALSPIEVRDWQDGFFDHRAGTLHVPGAYSNGYELRDLHFWKREIDKVWPDEKPSVVVSTPMRSLQAPAIPIDLNSLGAYIRGFPRVRETTREIAERVDQEVIASKELGGVGSAEVANALGFATIADLDAAMVENREFVIRMGAYLIPEQIHPDFSLSCLFCVVGGKMGADAYWAVIKDLKHYSASRAFCVEMEKIYGQISAY